ncbi:MAG TPA: CoB--CoM heterodisulfide reductase iron-sulfur subunit B family protein [Bacteroidales bacterium]|nr:CoB--CoM heterodisulfide reductase iron-sulfur subunit B family protein [Bacteroidales bacterium]
MSQVKTGIYPGCSLEGSARDYNESVFALAGAFGIELHQVPDWNCCGATAAHNMNKELSLALPARILALAEKNGLEEIVVPCAACYSRLMVTKHELMQKPELRNRISEVIGIDYRGTGRLLNVIEWVDKYIAGKIESKLVKPFAHKVACYYGCLLVRPNKILNYDRAENPETMDVVMKKIGATPVDFAFKTECCGAGLSISRTDLVSKLSGKIIEDAVHREAEAIIVACPMCHSNLDMRRPDINKYWNRKFDIPVIFLTQAIGLAVGLTPAEVGLKRHFVEVKIN